MSLIKTYKRENELVRLFNTPIVGSEKVTMNDKVFYMMIESLGVKVNRRKPVDSICNHKTCGNCGIKKSVDYFYSDSYSEDGYHVRCNSCDKTVNNSYVN